MKVACVITGGAAPDFKYVKNLLDTSDFVICADSGYDTAHQYGLKPDLIIGDMDSIQNSSDLEFYKANQRMLQYPVDKDFTDTELAMSYCRENGYEKIVLIGGGAGRFDHQAAIFFSFYGDLYPDLWITEKDEIRPIIDYYITQGSVGDRISFFPAAYKVKALSTGLKWSLNDLEWKAGSFSLSNKMESREIEIKIVVGRLVMLKGFNQAVQL